MSVYDAFEKFDGKSKIVSLFYKSEPDLLKGTKNNRHKFVNENGNPKVYKISQMNGIVGTDYEKVTRNRTENPEFKVEQLWGGKGEHLNKYLVRHKVTQRVYLAFLLNNVTKSGYYWSDGTELSNEEVVELKQYIRNTSNNSEVQWRTLPIDNVLEIKTDGEIYSRI